MKYLVTSGLSSTMKFLSAAVLGSGAFTGPAISNGKLGEILIVVATGPPGG